MSGQSSGVIIGFKSVKYGLQKPKQSLSTFRLEDEEQETEIPKSSFAHPNHQKRTQKTLDTALEQDPTVFDYDGIYDQMKAKTLSDKKRAPTKGPQYIPQLLKKAEEREKQRNLIFEKKCLREVQEEKILWGDTKSYITTGYKEQLKKNRDWEDQLKMRDSKGANVSTKGMSEFYNNLLTNNVAFGTGKSREEEDEDAKSELRRIEEQIKKEMEEEEKNKLAQAEKVKAEVTESDEVQSFVRSKKFVERKEETPEERKAKFIKRNNEDSIKEARERYLKRKQERKLRQAPAVNSNLN
eukprot:TRINITY_DN1842_c0_g1_i1.p1 TRINITY_DN1842_c0_g1~~TRINITY_DN1842_c0_g1_i1.p1  ORF type:complete len:297 (-),score=78.99 TRINITY_DN1842_c0_g1_i1:35-925(-)